METAESVRLYIENKTSWFNQKLIQIDQLSGGLTNFVYRLRFEDGSCVVLKYFPRIKAFNIPLEMSQQRYFVEKAALDLFSSQPWCQISPNSIIRTPKLLYYDDESFILIMEDAGEHINTLFDCLKLNSTLDNEFIKVICKELRLFLKYLSDHSNIRVNTHEVFKNEPVWELLESYYTQLWTSQIQKFNLEKELEPYLKEAKNLFKEKNKPDSVFVFGDLWPNSILIDEEKKLVWIVDWEVARFETRTRDLEQLIANLWIMKQNPSLFDSIKIDFMIKQFQLEFFGSSDSDFRDHCGSFAKKNFILWAIGLLSYKHWQIENDKDVALKALAEIE